ncbi:glycosyltransferase family 2 protein [Kiritimatiellota bacterium B12222]|nr:glycosyltransferase family 2 protein [Kiritimatiellota bacterium B12222]
MDTTSPHSPQHATQIPQYSVVIPFYNEEAAAPALIGEILKVMHSLEGSFECLCVNDGSTDHTSEILTQLAEQQPDLLRVINFTQNQGQAAALYWGLQEASGSIILILDGDGQNDPTDIPEMLLALQDHDLVCGIRIERNDSRLRRWMSRAANTVRSGILKDGMQDSGCALKAMRREVVSSLMPIRTLYSFIPAMAVGAGFKITQIPVKHRERNQGTSSYGLRAFLIHPLLDMIGISWYLRRSVLAPLLIESKTI